MNGGAPAGALAGLGDRLVAAVLLETNLQPNSSADREIQSGHGVPRVNALQFLSQAPCEYARGPA